MNAIKLMKATEKTKSLLRDAFNSMSTKEVANLSDGLKHLAVDYSLEQFASIGYEKQRDIVTLAWIQIQEILADRRARDSINEN